MRQTNAPQSAQEMGICVRTSKKRQRAAPLSLAGLRTINHLRRAPDYAHDLFE